MRIPGAAYALLVALVSMLAFFAIYRKVVFPDLFSGELRKRFALVREARRSEREERDAKGTLPY